MDFVQKVQDLREKYRLLREKHNIFGFGDPIIEDRFTERKNGRDIELYWLSTGQHIRLVDIPNTLSGDILRLKQDLPVIEGSFEINGDEIHVIEVAPLPPDPDDDSEDISDELAALPIIAVDGEKQHLKKCKYKSEIQTLLKCQGGSCPGQPLSPHIIQLLGKSDQGHLVFEKLVPRYITWYHYCSLAHFKRWAQHLVEAVKALHSIGVVHRDIGLENVLFTPDGQNLILADLECRWGGRDAPEIACDDGIDSGWTEKSDIYDIGLFIQQMIYANAPISGQVEWPVPAPFDSIVAACKRSDPLARPTLDEISAMLEDIEVE
jgi:hypothetical protein